MRGSRVYLDTMVIVEAHRINAWRSLAGAYRLLTVGKCVEEAATGNQGRTGYVEVDVEGIRTDFENILHPSRRQKADLILSLPNGLQLDPGERDLLAAAKADCEPWLLSGPDRAAFRALYSLGFMDRMVSVECLLTAIGIQKKNLRRNYQTRWVQDCRTRFRLDEA